MIASFILTEQEWQFALSGKGDAQSLLEKGLASADESGLVQLSRELGLVAEEARATPAAEIEPGVFARRGQRFCLLLEPYPRRSGTVKIALYKDGAALEAALAERREEKDETAD
ncbi:MAG: hypothetical protein LBS10_10455 [Gracilibacteraceae bacterium]|jgi:hypothetical protein|nr:hypothetical protein [Gracilibacteraceae bacterium]